MSSDAVHAASMAATGNAAALALLVKCLEQTGTLRAGAYAAVLRDNLEEAKAAANQGPFIVFQSLLNFLTEAEAKAAPMPPKRAAPDLRVITGGQA
jgi:hypothetical protein